MGTTGGGGGAGHTMRDGPEACWTGLVKTMNQLPFHPYYILKLTDTAGQFVVWF